ncbi:hypothetical protein GCM10010946_07310 [Undibacterium squillarum]|uniref:Haem-binding uptake Tiki superfamily ChaN domain-containing protein n=2 Tax=Undibacterium squillarum TaxID=1131567 RepID=A0ABQ2XU14_9BURK|nr:hypothetical protein GCM10010946_07310 [Undibacterium squillarum]
MKAFFRLTACAALLFLIPISMKKFLKLALSVCISGLFTTASADELVCPKEGKFPVAELKTRVLVIGETHGSNEYPAFAKSVVCQLLAANKPVILGLEIPENEQAAINHYLQSSGTAEDRRALQKGKFWQGRIQDGRSSVAMFGLIDAVRKLKQAGQKVLLAAFDISDDYKPVRLEKNEPFSIGRVDGEMTLNIIDRLRQYPEYTYVALVGSNHASRGKHYPNNPDFSPMAYLLSQREPIQTVYLSHQGGEFWVCRKPGEQFVCGPHNYSARETKISAQDDFSIELGKVTASPPLISLDQ